jgi:hypothetical protein
MRIKPYKNLDELQQKINKISKNYQEEVFNNHFRDYIGTKRRNMKKLLDKLK